MRPLMIATLILSLFAAGPRPSAGAPFADWGAFGELQKKIGALRQKDPKAALAECDQFAKAHPELDPWLDVALAKTTIDLTADGVKDDARAMALCDEALRRHEKEPAIIQPVGSKARLLIRAQRPAEAVALIEQYWSQFPATHRDYAEYCLQQYCTALELVGKKEKVLPILQSSVVSVPWLLDEAKQTPKGWIYEWLVQSLTAQNNTAEALSWAKVRFMTCEFGADAVERSSRALTKVWVARELSPKSAKAFSEAQQDPSKPNPLAAVKLPGIDPKTLEETQIKSFGVKGADLIHARISLLLLAGKLPEAMATARQLLMDDPESAAATQELCRVLKAAYLDVAHPNAFIEFLKTGEGTNPLEAFFKEHPASTGTN